MANFSGFLTKLNSFNKTALTILPIVAGHVIAVETAAKGEPGDTKEQKVIKGVVAGLDAAQTIPVPAVQTVADSARLVVAFLNFFGIFKHKADVPAASQPAAAVPLDTTQVSRD